MAATAAGLALVAALWLSLNGVAWARAVATRGEAWVSLPPSGPGYVTYSLLGAALGRQCVRPVVASVLTEALARVEQRRPGRRLVVAETGWCGGGRFAPHQTHRRGLSVDILVPVVDAEGEAASLPAFAATGWGYFWRFDCRGELAGLGWEAGRGCCNVDLPLTRRIDFHLLGELLVDLEHGARGRGARVRRVILAPELQPALLAATPAAERQGLARVLTTHRVWVRHDEHVHVDFQLDEAR